MTIRALRYQVTLQPVVDIPLTSLQHLGLKPSDCFIASYPRSGSTWLRFMLYELLTGNPSSFEQVNQTIPGPGRQFRALALLENGGRLIQTHEPWRREYQKAIYLVRDVRDVIVSEYRFCLRLQFFSGDFDAFYNNFIAGRVNRYGSWADHVDSWLTASKSNRQILVVRFEDLRDQTQTVLARLLSFMGVERTAAEVERTINNHTIERMRQKEDQAPQFQNNDTGIRFITNGSTGKGKQLLSATQMDQLLHHTSPILQTLGYLD